MSNNGGPTKLEIIAREARERTITNNVYQTTNQYSETHTRAISDELTPENGKGTGRYLDTTDGGSRTDKKGVVGKANTGREGNLVLNQYNKTNEYQRPDTSGNVGQIRF